MENIIINIVKEKNTIGKGSFGVIYFSEKYPEYIVKKMKKYHIFCTNYISNNLKELWWNYIISKSKKVFKNISYLSSFFITENHIFMLMDHKGISIHETIKTIIKNEDETSRNDSHIKLLKLIPLIIYNCSKILFNLSFLKMRHGDITTSNILIDKNNHITIIDWGSIFFNKMTNASLNQCAHDFSAPELRNHEDELFLNIPSIKNDIFSLGITILRIIDPTFQSKSRIVQYITKSKTYDTVIVSDLDSIIDYIKTLENIKENTHERIFFLIKKMIEIDIESRIDIESLYMDPLFDHFRKNDDQINKNLIKNVFKIKLVYSIDSNKENFINQLYIFLKDFKNKDFKNLLDSRIILTPSIQLFYSHNVYENKNINSYIISFLCSVKWIDIILNNDISMKDLYFFYNTLFNFFEKKFENNIKFDFTNFYITFDIIMFNIIKQLDGYIFKYPDHFDLNFDKINYRSIKKLLIRNITLV